MIDMDALSKGGVGLAVIALFAFTVETTAALTEQRAKYDNEEIKLLIEQCFKKP